MPIRARVKPLHPRSIGAWFSETVKETEVAKIYRGEASATAQAGGGLWFAKLLAQFKALFRVESKDRTQVREILKRFPGALLESVNQFLDEARKIDRSGFGA